MRFDLLDEFSAVCYPFSQIPSRLARNGTEDFGWDRPAIRQPRPVRRPLFAAYCASIVLAGLSVGAAFIGW